MTESRKRRTRNLSATDSRYQVASTSVHGAVIGDNASVSQNFAVAKPVTPSALFQLPADAGNFTGRRDEIQTIVEQLHGETSSPKPITVICGMAGVGKTALAVHVAHMLSSEYPEAQLYVNLNSYEPALRLDPGQALDLFLRALGVAVEALPVTYNEQMALYRSLLADKRAIILIDNAVSAEQVRPLLPGSHGCIVLVTTRDRMPGLIVTNAARLVILEPLRQNESMALLTEIVGADRVGAEAQQAKDLVDLCGNLPLALMIAAARLVVRPKLTVSNLSRRLSEEGRRLIELAVGDVAVRASFNSSYEQLGDDNAQLFRLLALNPGTDFSLDAAAAVMDIDSSTAGELLESLVDMHLVEPATASDQYRMHNLVRIFSREKLHEKESENDLADAEIRLLSWYRRMVSVSEQKLLGNRIRFWQYEGEDDRLPAPTTRGSALAWFEQERANIIGACRQANRSALHEITWQIADASWGFFQLRKYWSEWEESHRLGLASAIASENKQAEAWMLTGLGGAQWERHEYVEAERNLKRALAIHQTLKDEMGECRTLMNLGFAYYQMGNQVESIKYSEQALRISRTRHDDYRTAWILYGLSNAHTRLNRNTEALKYCEEALVIWRNTASRMGEGFSLDSLGSIYRNLGDLKASIVHLEQALAIRREVGDSYGEGMTLDNLGKTYELVAGRSHAIPYWFMSVEILTQLGAPEADEVRSRLGETPQVGLE